MDDELILEWIGTGSAMNYELGDSNFLLKKGKSKVVVDLSLNNATVLIARDFELSSLTNFIITHIHGDHINGLECTGFWGWNILGRKNEERPTIYVASENILTSLKLIFNEKMKYQQWQNNTPFDADFDFYFKTKIGTEINIDELPTFFLHPTLHVQNMECYGIHVPEYGLWISGDTREVKDLPEGTILAFRDAGGPDYETRVHSDFNLDLKDRPLAEKKLTYLYHCDGKWRQIKPKQHSFAGMAMPGDKFILDCNTYSLDTGNVFIHQRVPYTDMRE